MSGLKLVSMAQILQLSQELDTEAGAATLLLSQHGDVVLLERLNETGKLECSTAIGADGKVVVGK